MKYITVLTIFLTNVFAVYDSTKNAQDLNMYYQDYNFLMALSGALVGFIFMLILLILITQISRR